MTTSTIEEVYTALSQRPGLAERITMNQSIHLVRLVAALKRAIIHDQLPSYDESKPPSSLPQQISDFLQVAVGIYEEDFEVAWAALKVTAWHLDLAQHSEMADGQCFFGVKQGMSMTLRSKFSTEYAILMPLKGNKTLYPPVTRCTNSHCPANDKLLRSGDRAEKNIVLWTMNSGACATYHMQLKCASMLPSSCIVITNLTMTQCARLCITTIIMFKRAGAIITEVSLITSKSGSIILLNGKLQSYF
jgi:hypothetical protein